MGKKETASLASYNPVTACCKLCSKSKEPMVVNEFGASEAAFWLLIVYYFFGSMFYTRIFESQTTGESMYFLTVTMTVRISVFRPWVASTTTCL